MYSLRHKYCANEPYSKEVWEDLSQEMIRNPGAPTFAAAFFSSDADFKGKAPFPCKVEGCRNCLFHTRWVYRLSEVSKSHLKFKEWLAAGLVIRLEDQLYHAKPQEAIDHEHITGELVYHRESAPPGVLFMATKGPLTLAHLVEHVSAICDEATEALS
jgi:hypothetical protein